MKMPLYSKITFTLALWCVFILQCYLPNMGGSGLRLPHNLMAWGTMAVIAGVIFYHQIRRREILRYSSVFLPALSGIFLLGLPLLWSPEALWQWNALMRVLGIAGAFLFFYSLLQLPLNYRQKRLWAWLLLAASLGQICLTSMQVFYPNAIYLLEFNPLRARPHGIFQQPNVLASFLATGLLLAIWLFTTTRNAAASLILIVSLLVHSAWIVMIQSRIGGLGALAGTFALGLLCFRRKLFWLALAIAFAGAAIAWFGMPEAIAGIDKSGSNSERLLTLKYSLQMIGEHPWLGWGYGSFEHEFVRYVFSEGMLPPLGLRQMTHPHNELLLAWVEGGIIALAGMLLLIVAWFRLIPAPGKTCKRVSATAFWIMTLPIALHTMTEYPLYQSAPHIFVLMILCRLAASEQEIKSRGTEQGYRVAASVLMVAAFSLALFMFSGLQTNAVLTQAERHQLVDFPERTAGLINPWVQFKRLEYDRNVRLLLDYNETGETKLLRTYRPWAETYLRTHNDANTYWSLIRVYQLNGDSRNAALYRAAAQYLFPGDSRFH